MLCAVHSHQAHSARLAGTILVREGIRPHADFSRDVEETAEVMREDGSAKLLANQIPHSARQRARTAGPLLGHWQLAGGERRRVLGQELHLDVEIDPRSIGGSGHGSGDRLLPRCCVSSHIQNLS